MSHVIKVHAPQAQIVFDKFHIMAHLGKAMDKVRKAEYARLSGEDRRYIKGQKYTLLSHRENLSLEGRKALKQLLAANKRLNTAYLLKEQFGQLWSYRSPAGPRKFCERWREALKAAWLAWRQQARDQALRASLAGLDARTLRDIGLGEFAAPPGATLSALDWERGRW